MQSQQFFQQGPQEKTYLMKEHGWTLITGLIVLPGAVLSLIATILGKVVFVDFNWFVGYVGILMLAILIFGIWYDIRSRRKQKEQYEVSPKVVQPQVLHAPGKRGQSHAKAGCHTFSAL